MKVPTYTSQAAIPRQGQGMFTTVQLNSSAMEAPGLAIAERGQKTEQGGEKALNFGLKRAEVAADSAAQEASDNFETDLESRKIKALNDPNTAAADKVFRQDSKTLESTFRSTLSTGLAKREFSTLANDVRRRSIIDFTKKNNKRVVDQSKANLNRQEAKLLQQASDVEASTPLRSNAFGIGLALINEAAPDIGYAEAAARQEKFTEAVVSNTLTNQINQPGANALAIIESFRTGSSTDPAIQGISEKLSADQVNKIADGALKAANRAIKARQDAAKQEEAEANADNDALHNYIVNVDLSDPLAVSLAEENHKRLLAAGYYETEAKRKAVENLLETDESDGPFKATPESEELQGTIEEKESLNTLTYEDLLAVKGKVDPKFYGRMLQQLEQDRTQSRKDGIDLFKDAFMYTEQADAALLKTPSRMAFRKASLQFKKWVSENRRASPDAVDKKAREIVKSMQADFIAKMRSFRQKEYIVAYSKLPASLKGIIPNPSSNSIEAVKDGVANALANSNDGMLLSFQELLNKEAELQILE